MLEIKDISVAFNKNKVLDRVSFTAEQGKIIGLAAPNGTGKTTLFNVIANYTKPNSGDIIVDENYTYSSEKAQLKIHQQLTTFPDQSDLFEELNGVDHIKLYKQMWKGSKKPNKIIQSLKMESYAKNKVKTYSLGMRQRLCFAMMVAADSKILLMDEVMNGLDVSNVSLISTILNELKSENKLIFVASHLLENLDLYADRVIFLKDGGIIDELHPNNSEMTYLKVPITTQDYEQIQDYYNLPSEHEFISSYLLCIPLHQMSISDQLTWIERMLAFQSKQMTIGSIGTLEYYEKHYEI
ncbi:ABC transporter ATP-binding protein [Halalkalibacillus halophilus]|uniref:ATP-binding cassette domain-containing protein n=1 Tax=Halalkalibacillus halophilus TaxID=392827 RepID=UPI0004156CD2|nr:ABC transporter ATP-binding protein [Halalkalibacillus halophilus]